jgi:hypothetical protein
MVRDDERATMTVRAIRVGLVDVPRLLREILVTTFESQPDFEVDDTFGPSASLVAAAVASNADVLITASTALAISDLHTALFARPRMKILSIELDGRRAFLHELYPRRVALGELSPDGLMEQIRRIPETAR